MLKSRPMNILNVFLNSKESVSAKELSIMFNKTERTIRNDLRDINEFLHSNEFLEINNQSGSFILNLTNSERVKLKEIVSGRVEEQSYNPVYRRAYILSHALMNHSHQKIYELCEDLQISKSTMDKDMKLLRQSLDKYNLKIVSNISTGLSIDGNEIDIRTFLYDYLVRRITEDKVFIDDLYDQYNPLVAYIGLNQINKIKDNYSKVIGIEQNDIKLSVIILTAIWICRVQNGHILDTDKDDKQKELSIINIFVDEVMDWNFKEVSLGEFNYIYNRLDVLIGNKKQVSDDKHEALSQLVSLKLIEYVEHELSIDFNGYQSYLFEGLNKHISGLISRLQQGIQIYNPLKENIKNSHYKFFQTIKKYSMNRLNRYIDLDFTEDEIAFITVYFSTAYFKYVQQNKHFFNAVIVCSFGIATSNLLAEILKSHFNVNIIRILASNEEDFIENDNVDIVFTTIDAEFNKPTCYVNAIVNETDIKKIEGFLEQHAYLSRNNEKVKRNEVSLFKDISIWLENKGMKLNETDYKDIKHLFETNNFNFNDKEVQPMLNEVLEDHHVLLNETCTDWKNAIKKVSKPLLEDGIITSQYQDAMIQSVEEYGPYIVIGKHIALAHARPEEGANALGVSIATLNPNIEFGNEINDPVKIIFCLSATDSFSHLNIMKSIVSLVRNEEKVNRLLSFDDKNQFIDYLLKEEIS